MTLTANSVDSATNVFGKGGLIWQSKTHCQSKDPAMQWILSSPIKFISKQTELKQGEVRRSEDGKFTEALG